MKLVIPPPAGFQIAHLATGPAWLRPASKNMILSLWQKLNPTLPLRLSARRHPKHRIFPGRAPVVVLPYPGLGEIVVRPCVHGGCWGKMMRDFYLGPTRALREILQARQLESKKIPTPSILAVLFYPAGPFWKIDVVTSFVPESRDLASFLSTRPKPGERARAFTAVRKLFDACARHRIRHPDLNARNILLSGSAKKPLQAWLLDVDAIRIGMTNRTRVVTANRNRLLRSLIKRARCGDLGWSEKEIASLWKELFPKG